MIARKLVITMTGFSSDPREEEYKNMLNDLGMQFAPKLFEETNILIVKTVINEKYKIAMIYDRPIDCVTIEWLIESFEKGQPLPTEMFCIPKMFYGVEIHLLEVRSTRSSKVKRMKNLLEQNGAKVKIIDEKEYIEVLQKKIVKLFLVEKEIINNFRQYFVKADHIVVSQQWLEDSLSHKKCKFPPDYALNGCHLQWVLPSHHTRKMTAKLQYCLQSQFSKSMRKCELIFQNLLFYIHHSVNYELSQCLKELISINGGFYIDELNCSITHTLTNFISEQQYQQNLKKNGKLTYILKVEWLIDCIYLGKRVNEQDYLLRSFLSNKETVGHSEDSGSNNFNSVRSCLSARKKSVSVGINHSSSIKTYKKSKVLSQLFRGHHFYIESSHRKDSDLRKIDQDIMRNGGEVFKQRNQINYPVCWFVLKDCKDWKQLIVKLDRDTRGKVNNIQVVSHRWVKECIDNNLFIDPIHVQSYIYKPLSFKMPLLNFHKMVFDIIGLQLSKKQRLKQLYNVMGSLKNAPNKREVTHCLCGEAYKESARFKELQNENSRVIYLRWEWLLDCCKQGISLDYGKYLCEPIKDVKMEVNSSKDTSLFTNEEGRLNITF